MPFNTALIRSLLLDAWLIDPAFAESMLPIVLDSLGGDNQTKLSDHVEKPMPTLLADAGPVGLRGSDGSFSGFGGAGRGSAIIPIRGAITKYDGFCSYGVESYLQWIDDAERSDNVDTIVLLIDSPGGQANASFLLADRIARATKPVVAYVDGGAAASGAYLILSAADVAYAATPVDLFGSIGAMISITDFRSKLEGSKTWEIYSRLSTEKNASWRRLKENNDPSLIQDMLDINVQHFVDTVKRNRSSIQTSQIDPFKGATYTADVALSIGLIDGIGTMQQAISAAKTSKQPKEDMNWKARLASWLMTQPDDDSTPETTAETTTIDAPTVETATTEAPETNAYPSSEELQSQISQLTSQIESLTTENTRLTSENTRLQAQLDNKPAASPTTPVVAQEDVPEAPSSVREALSYLTETDRQLAEMRAAMKPKAIK